MTKTVMAAIDVSPAARPVLETARDVARLTGAAARALHVAEDHAETLEQLAASLGVPLDVVDGPVRPALLRAFSDPDVVVGLLGARSTPTGRRPTGRTALHVVERTHTPIVVVPPEALHAVREPLPRLLLPLEGSEESSVPVVERLCPLLVAGAELLVLHVFTSRSTPRILDRPARDMQLWAHEFRERFLPRAASVECRSGPVTDRILEVASERDVDLIVLSWSQDASPGHAAIVCDVLARSLLPVLLLPVDAVPGGV
jgi:nucleotide-binding universal stress UspA family protein